MDSSRDGKRKKDKNEDDDDKHRDKKSKRARSRKRSPGDNCEKDFRRKRRHSKSRSPGVPTKQEKPGNGASKEHEVKKEVPERRAKETDMLNTRTGGAYIPPARLRMMQAQITDKSSVAYQRLAWEALKKSIHGHINKINVGNIGIIIKQLLKENIVRGRGLLCRSVIQAQAASPTFTNVYAALVSAVNSRFPNIGELLLKRLVIQFKRGFKRNDKPTCISSASFIAHLVNQRVAHEILALELLTLLVETPTDDSVEVAIAFLKECGQKLTEVSSKGVNAIFEMLRNILHEGQLDKRVQYMIEVMFQVWKDGFKDHPALIEELELVPEEEQFTHLLMLDDATDPQDILNVFKFDDKYEENEQKYKTLSKEILGSDAESGEEDGSEGSGSEDEEDEDDNETQKPVTIIDNTETNLVALRRTIYLTINSSLDFEECAHKLMKMQLKPGQEVELCHMFLDCCAEQRTYEKFYGLLAQRFCNINRIYIGPFEEIFKDSYSTAHRLDTNRLRNVSKFFAHLLFTDSISWEVLECVKLNEEDTTSSSRIYIKILFQELAEYMGLKKLNDRLQDPTLQEAFSGVFPRDNPKNTRFSINFFTSIGLGGLTDQLREHLKQMPKNVPAPITEINLNSGSNSESSSSSSSDSSSSDSSASDSSDAEEENSKKKKKEKSKSKKKKSNTPKTPEGDPDKDKSERWGHDGFYDTYGKDAQRTVSRTERQDRNNFVKPQDKGRNEFSRDRQEPERNYDHRNGDDRRQDRRDDRNERDKRQDEDRRNDRNRQDRADRDRYRRDENYGSNRSGRDDDKRISDRDKNRYDEDRTDKNEDRRDHERTQKESRNFRSDDTRYARNREDERTDTRKKTRREDYEGDKNRREEYDRAEENNRSRRDEERNEKKRQDNAEREQNRTVQNVGSERNDNNKRDDNERLERETRNRRDENERNDKYNYRNRRDDDRTDKHYKERDNIEKSQQHDNEADKNRERNNESRKERDQREEMADSNRRNRDRSSEDKSPSRDRYHADQKSKNERDEEDKYKVESKNIRQKKAEKSRDRRAHRKESVQSSDDERRKEKSNSRNKGNRKETDSSEDSSSEDKSPKKSRKKNKKRKDTNSSDEGEARKTHRRKNRNTKIDPQHWDISSRDKVQAEIVGSYWNSQNYEKKEKKTKNREKRRDK